MTATIQLFHKYSDIKSEISLKLKNEKALSLGLVPTMGHLHKGHLSLLNQSLHDNDISVFTIFVNPNQFSKDEDFDSYPRNIERDSQLINEAFKHFSIKHTNLKRHVFIFAPESPSEVYHSIQEEFPNDQEIPLEKELEGRLRPTHFRGVLQVVYKLFHLFHPTKAYFGAKDYQQLTLIKWMVQCLQLKTQVVGLPIVRENDGLAMSSRNIYLSTTERAEALLLSKTLFQLVEQTKEIYTKSHQMIDDHFHHQINDLIHNIQVKDQRFNYLSLRETSLLKAPSAHSNQLIWLGNFQLGKTRLLDNLEFSL